MPHSDDIPSSPLGPGASLEESLKFYKAQYESLEAELSDFQASSKDLEAELEKDIEAAEKRERQLKDKAAKLQYEVDEWKEKYRQAKTEAGAAQNVLQKEVTQLRESNRELQMRLRDTEVANDDYERQQRNTESTLEGMQAQYHSAFEKSVLLQQEVETVEQEREGLRIDVQRLKDELQDFKIEAEIVRERLVKAEEELERRPSALSIRPTLSSISPRSNTSPTTTNASTLSFDTPPAKTASSSGISDMRTPPSPPESERSSQATKPTITPSFPKTRLSMNVNTTPRQPIYPGRVNGHVRGQSSVAVTSHAGPTSAFRQSLSKPLANSRVGNLPQSSSIMQLRNLRGKMQNLEQRVQKARSKLPAPVNTPPRSSPRPTSALEQPIPSSVTVRSRKRDTGSNINGSLPDSDPQSTPAVSQIRSFRQSLGPQSQSQPSTSPVRGAMLPPRASSRASGISSRTSGFVPSHSRPGSRASLSGFRPPMNTGIGGKQVPNASTDRVVVRPQSSLSDYHRNTTYDGQLDEGDELQESILEETESKTYNMGTPTPGRRQSTLLRPRISDVGASTIPTPTGKRLSMSGMSKLPGPTRRQSQSNIALIGRPESRTSEIRTPSRQSILRDVTEDRYDVNETF